MSPSTPVVFLLHGEDEFAIAQFVSRLEDDLGDAASASMNITRLDARSLDLAKLPGITSAMPFLTKKRLVVISRLVGQLKTQADRQKLQEILEKIPPTTQLVIIEDHPLTSDNDRRSNKLHWLEKWAAGQGDRVKNQPFPLPKGPEMVRWIIDQAHQAGGAITPPAAELISSFVDSDPRLAKQEIEKLLAYVNYNRAVEPDDVQAVSVDVAEGNIFAMVDALGARDGRRAMAMLHRLLESQDPFSIFGMVVRQFRLLLLTREIMERRGRSNEVAQKLKVPGFVAEKMMKQAGQFDLNQLEAVYRRLCELDEGMKTSQILGDLALDTFVADFTYRGR